MEYEYVPGPHPDSYWMTGVDRNRPGNAFTVLIKADFGHEYNTVRWVVQGDGFDDRHGGSLDAAEAHAMVMIEHVFQKRERKVAHWHEATQLVTARLKEKNG